MKANPAVKFLNIEVVFCFFSKDKIYWHSPFRLGQDLSRHYHDPFRYYHEPFRSPLDTDMTHSDTTTTHSGIAIIRPHTARQSE